MGHEQQRKENFKVGIRDRLKVKSVVIRIETQQLQWFGHVVKMGEDRSAKVIWETHVDAKKRRGRLERTWNNQIADNLGKRVSIT